MSLLSLTSRVLRIKSNLINIRCMSDNKLERPNLRFTKSRPKSRVFDKGLDETEYDQHNKPPGPIKYILLGIPIITFILGTWQVERRKLKLQLIEDLKKRTTADPKPLPEDLHELAELEYYPIKVRGQFLYDKEFTIGPRSLIVDGSGTSEKGSGGGLIGGSGARTGYWIITPFKLEDRDLTILVNRGWIPKKLEKMPVDKLGRVPGIVEITGLLRLNEERAPFMPKNKPAGNLWFHRDLVAMAESADADPIFMDLVVGDGVRGGPIAGQTRVYMRNEHLSYIITWYSLSLITSWFWIRLYIQKLPLL
ncbi:surfeit locus protein 1 [Microplitis demolitor]|uniref:surfeit locus protein 1 n=1 Tax=Microplitis demolitor TaxID=69319 RepID=UPI0004CCB43B|nr:surfeit locus protein 1 [Microplitis demolitor]